MTGDTLAADRMTAVPLVDHHCHSVVGSDIDRATFEVLLTEASAASRFGTSLFDSLIGLAVRRWCAPVLGLPAHSPPDDYLTRRAELGAHEVNCRFLQATGTTDFLVDSGVQPDSPLSLTDLGHLTGANVHEVVRLEKVTEDVVRAGTSVASFIDDVDTALAARTSGAIAVKSIAAYRCGLGLVGHRPTDAEVRVAANEWMSKMDTRADSEPRLAHEVLHRFLLWRGIDLGLPVQIHVGYGDADLDLHHGDPLLLTDFLRATQEQGVPVMLLHNYPFHRHAAYLAQVFEHVFLDVGLATHNVGIRASSVIAETLELAPFSKFLFSTDAFGLAEHYYLGALLFRRGLAEFLRNGIEQDAWTCGDATRLARLIGADNARRVYSLP